MINLKFSIYNSLISISDKISILYNSKVDKCLAIPKGKEYLIALSPNEIFTRDKNLYNQLIEIGAIIRTDKDELDEVIKKSKEIDNSDDHFKLIINPTMGCNFSCWYCYESHIVGSKMSNNNINKIFKFIDNTILEKPNLKTFDLSFFGGEPLMYYSKVTRSIIDYYRSKYEQHKNINFEISFTSNGFLYMALSSPKLRPAKAFAPFLTSSSV